MGNNKRIIFLSFIVLFFLLYFLVKNIKDVETIVRNAGLAGPVVVIFLYGIFAATPISTDPLTIACGILFGPVMGSIISWIGNNIASGVEYYVGGHIRRITNFKKSKKKLPFGLNRLRVDSPWFLIFGRLIPVYGGKIISIMAGVYHVPIGLYLWTTGLTNLFGSLLLSFGGYHIIRSLPFLK